MTDTQQQSAQDHDKGYVVARVEDIPEGTRLFVNVEGREIGIFNVDGRLYAILNRCPHRGGELCKGDVLGLVTSECPGEMRLDTTTKFIVCPWHGWEFDIETGQSWYEGPRDAKTRRRYRDARRFGVEVKRGTEVEEGLSTGTAELSDADDAVFLNPGTHRIKGPYTADMFPVKREDDYIVVTLRR